MVFIEQYKSQDKEVRFDFYWLGGKEVKKQTNKISFVNSQLKIIYIIIENQINLINFGWIG